jgi:hypothetical protein
MPGNKNVSNESPGGTQLQIWIPGSYKVLRVTAAAALNPGSYIVCSPGPGWRRGIPNLSRVDSTLKTDLNFSTSYCLFLVSSAPGAELAVAVVQAEAACLHQARNI